MLGTFPEAIWVAKYITTPELMTLARDLGTFAIDIVIHKHVKSPPYAGQVEQAVPGFQGIVAKGLFRRRNTRFGSGSCKRNIAPRL